MPGKPSSVASPNLYTSVPMPSSPARHGSNYDSQPNSSGDYERLHFQQSGAHESLGGGYERYDRKTSLGGQSSKLNPVFDESLSTNVSLRSGPYGG